MCHQRDSGTGHRLDPQRLGFGKHKDVGEHFPFDVGDKRFAALTRFQLLDFIRAEVMQELLPIATGQFNLNSVANIEERATRVAGFTLFVVGEGIEKRVDDFAAEVAAQVAAAKGA